MSIIGFIFIFIFLFVISFPFSSLLYFTKLDSIFYISKETIESFKEYISELYLYFFGNFSDFLSNFGFDSLKELYLPFQNLIVDFSSTIVKGMFFLITGEVIEG